MVADVGIKEIGFGISAVDDKVQMVDVSQAGIGWVAPRLGVEVKAKREVRLKNAVYAIRSFVNFRHPVKKAFGLPGDGMLFVRIGRPFVDPQDWIDAASFQ